jgi:hypothetical protein
MSVVRFSVSLVAIIGLMAATIAGATIWLLLTDPVRTADAAGQLASGNVRPVCARARRRPLRRASGSLQVPLTCDSDL